MTGTCHYCGREDVELARYRGTMDGESWEFDVDMKLFITSVKPICLDCTNVTSHFMRKGLRAFRESLSSSKQLDLFPVEKIIDES